MSDIDDNIKQVLQFKIQAIDDDSFTKRVVDRHLANKQIRLYKPFNNFLSFVIGLSLLLISLGLIFILKQNYNWTSEIGINLEEGMILLMLSIVFLIYKILDETITTNSAVVY